jgi:basic membrane protein A
VGDPTLQPVILTSMLKRVDVAVFETLEKFSKDEEIPAQTVFDLSTDGVGYSESGGFVADIKTQLEDLKAKIIAGEIKVPTTP